MQNGCAEDSARYSAGVSVRREVGGAAPVGAQRPLPHWATPAQYLLGKEIWDFESGQDKAQELLDHAISQAKK
jgi:hypothetical protein